DRRDEREDDRDREAYQPGGKPPPRRPEGEQPEEDVARSDRHAESEADRLRKIVQPTDEGLSGQPERLFPPVSSDESKRKIDRGHEREQDGQKRDRGRPWKHRQRQHRIAQGARPAEHEGERESRRNGR